jgi:DNA-3-methyladenine glycosylase
MRDTITVAKRLLGKVICHRTRGGKVLRARIVETEAYLGIGDAAAHSFGDRKTARTKSMYMDGGHSYVFFIYGMYHCLNVVTRTADHPEAVLIRAGEPVPSPSGLVRSKMPTNGPGKLCRYLELNRDHDGLELWTKKSGLWIEDAPPIPNKKIAVKSRVGVDYAGEAALWPLRFYILDHPYVSKK